MQNSRRETLLKIGVGAVVGLFLLDRVIITPAFASWKAQGERLTKLREEVQRGRQLVAREKSLRGRWEEMQRLLALDQLPSALHIFSQSREPLALRSPARHRGRDHRLIEQEKADDHADPDF